MSKSPWVRVEDTDLTYKSELYKHNSIFIKNDRRGLIGRAVYCGTPGKEFNLLDWANYSGVDDHVGISDVTHWMPIPESEG